VLSGSQQSGDRVNNYYVTLRLIDGAIEKDAVAQRGAD
jgi:hypothetical protein